MTARQMACPPECIVDHGDITLGHFSAPVTTVEGGPQVRLQWTADGEGYVVVEVGGDTDGLTLQEAREFASLIVQHADRLEHGTPIPAWTCVSTDHDHGAER